jgi:hypothetical protein
VAALGLIVLLYPGLTPTEASDIMVPHHEADRRQEERHGAPDPVTP